MFDLDAYLERVGLDGEPDLSQMHLAHATAIPFENLDPHSGRPVALDSESLQGKLVQQRRGGYCFEQNLLLKAALEAAGLRVETMLARVRWGSPPGAIRPLTHLVLRVSDERGVWHADVGFGSGTLLEPIPFGPGGPYEQAGWHFRVVEEPGLLVLQTDSSGDWRDMYAFRPEPAPQIDLEVNNWFTCTHPSSSFVTGLLVAKHDRDGTRISVSDWVEDLQRVVRRPGQVPEVTPLTWNELPQLLAAEFGLAGWASGGEARLQMA